jgi:hypothetical protein
VPDLQAGDETCLSLEGSQQFNRTSIEEEMFLQSNAQNAWKDDQWQRSPHD